MGASIASAAWRGWDFAVYALNGDKKKAAKTVSCCDSLSYFGGCGEKRHGMHLDKSSESRVILVYKKTYLVETTIFIKARANHDKKVV